MFINLELYRVFYFAAKLKSISKAAEELYITQPAVSQSIKQLEDKLGGQLFFRTTKGIKLTDEGAVLYKYIEQAYSFILTAESKFSEMQNLMSGEIKIGASDTLCKYYLLTYLEKFNIAYPHINIQVTNRTTQETINLLKSGKVDLGFINLPIEKDTHLIIKETLSLQDCFVVGEKYKFLAKEKISINELIKYPILMLEKGSNTRRYIDSYAENLGIKILPAIELGSLDLLAQFASIGLGAACVTKNFIKEDMKKLNLYEIKLKETIPQRKIGIITLKEVPQTASAKKFIEMLT